MKGRQDADAVDRAGLRLRLLKQQAEAGDITLLFGDESEALTHPYLARAWAKRGSDLRIEAPGQARKRAMIGAFDFAARKLIVSTSATKRSSDFISFLGRLDAIYGPVVQNKPFVLVLDNGPIHTSKASQAALAARPWLTVEWLPKYAPELNDIERAWRDLKRHFLAHQTFTDTDHLDRAIHNAVNDMNVERQRYRAPTSESLLSRRHARSSGGHFLRRRALPRPGLDLRGATTRRAYRRPDLTGLIRAADHPRSPHGTPMLLREPSGRQVQVRSCGSRRCR